VLLASRDPYALFQVVNECDEAMSLEGEHELGDHVAMCAGDHCRQLAGRSIKNERPARKNRNAERSRVAAECRLSEDGEEWWMRRCDVDRFADVVWHQGAMSERGERLREAFE
jgi:hypothetical protein